MFKSSLIAMSVFLSLTSCTKNEENSISSSPNSQPVKIEAKYELTLPKNISWKTATKIPTISSSKAKKGGTLYDQCNHSL